MCKELYSAYNTMVSLCWLKQFKVASDGINFVFRRCKCMMFQHANTPGPIAMTVYDPAGI